MKSKMKIAIPNPCNENWNKMTPKEKGRFCNSCSKTVVDFTKKSTETIKQYLIEYKDQKICGHFYKKQLDTIVLEIPEVNFNQQLSFQKLFLLALLFTMGTTLFSCQYSDGKKQKIEKVIIKDSVKIINDELGLIFPLLENIDSLKTKNTKTCQTPIKTDSLINSLNNIEIIEVVEALGEIITIEGDIEYEEYSNEEVTFGFVIIDETPRFTEAKGFTKSEAKKDFNERIQAFVQNNFNSNTTINLGLNKGEHRIYTQFEIDEKGEVTNIKIRAPHPYLKNKIEKMLQKLPKLIPGKQNGKIVKTKYTLPISFIVSE